MPCDHDRLKQSVEAFDAGTRPVIRNGEVQRQYGARLHDCITCPPDSPSTFMHPGDLDLVEAYFAAEEAARAG